MIITEHIHQMQNATIHGINTKFNCWGATQYALGKRKKWGWVGEQVMRRWLREKTVTVKQDLTLGDILVLVDKNRQELIHTAVYVGNNTWFHKVGKFEATFETSEKVIAHYFHDINNAEITIHRLK